MRYKNYDKETKKKVVMAKLANPKISYESLCLEFGIGCPETIRYWIYCYKLQGDKSFVDKRYKL